MTDVILETLDTHMPDIQTNSHYQKIYFYSNKIIAIRDRREELHRSIRAELEALSREYNKLSGLLSYHHARLLERGGKCTFRECFYCKMRKPRI